ncbi:GntR family transcriptional regulator [Filifactor villosus]|uniref:GntR family transcriptional regulator n=1 Tax=Filifactor villosus TaxID=29374 RepID=A0ABV9QIR7_9FIRM
MEKEQGVSYDSPYYIQLREVLRNKIETGEYLPGTAIPSEPELAKLYGLNQKTVRSAIELLVKEGLLKKIQGKGTFVEGDKIQRDISNMEGFISKVEQRRDDVEVKVLKKYLRRAGEYYAKVFDMGKNEELYFVQRLIARKGVPISVEESYIEKKILPVIEDVNLSVYSIRDIFDFYGITITKTRQYLNIVKTDSKTAKLLKIDPEDYILKFSGCHFNDEGRIVECFNHYSRGDILRYQVEFSGQK